MNTLPMKTHIPPAMNHILNVSVWMPGGRDGNSPILTATFASTLIVKNPAILTITNNAILMMFVICES